VTPEPITPITQTLIVAMCSRAAELWSMGEEEAADRWFVAAGALVDGREFVDAGADQ
jgi:hypothetical protein